MQVNRLDINVCGNLCLQIYPYTSSALMFIAEDASDYGESKWQIQEGCEYHYEIIDGNDDASNWILLGPDKNNIIFTDPHHTNRGILKTGIHVGRLNVSISHRTHKELRYPLAIEIQSVKSDYRKDYRQMLSDITTYYTDLVMMQGSPVSQRFEVDNNASSQTLYQKFAFIKGIVDNSAFDESIHKVVSSPVKRWTNTLEERRIESVSHLKLNEIKQLTSRSDRIPIGNAINGMNSLPRSITVSCKTDTVDTQENQFVKYVLTSFYGFCSNLSTKKNATDSLKFEIGPICDKLSSHLHNSFFKQISLPSRLDIGSPVLQRKEGYREILQAWLKFDLAAKITWDGGDEVYEAGKKNVAVLYEYWLFFKLMDVVSDVFKITPEQKTDLVKADEDGICLDIKQGKTKVIRGVYDSGNRLLNVSLFYNRTFGYTDDVKSTGSWTLSMRPDYTLSIWPGEKDEKQAERDDTIVHIHFDAKYRLNRILLDDKDSDEVSIQNSLNDEKKDREIDIYKRGDLLKMHAYKDAIRRTGGAYVLYPGRDKQGITNKVGFHEIIPGLGAFCIAPGHEDDQLPALKQFIKEIITHFMDRTSQREKIAVSSHQIHEQQSLAFNDSFPEPDSYGSFPDTTPIIIGCYKSKDHLHWIERKGKYNIRLGGLREGAVELNTPLTGAKYLLLYSFETKEIAGIYRIISQSPQIVTSDTIELDGYPGPTPGQLYLVFDISADAVEEELRDRDWTIEHLVQNNGAPVLIKYSNLFPPR